jgi:hypothetical protein
MEHLHQLRQQDPFCRFHLIVPEYHPSDHPWTETEVRAAAKARLDAMLEHMAAMSMRATGEVGDSNPVYAIGVTLRREGMDAFNGIILSTLPKRLSLWWDVPRRISREYPDIPLTHLVAEDSLVS